VDVTRSADDPHVRPVVGPAVLVLDDVVSFENLWPRKKRFRPIAALAETLAVLLRELAMLRRPLDLLVLGLGLPPEGFAAVAAHATFPPRFAWGGVEVLGGTVRARPAHSRPRRRRRPCSCPCLAYAARRRGGGIQSVARTKPSVAFCSLKALARLGLRAPESHRDTCGPGTWAADANCSWVRPFWVRYLRSRSGPLMLAQ
jgi:hypothetical protein